MWSLNASLCPVPLIVQASWQETVRDLRAYTLGLHCARRGGRSCTNPKWRTRFWWSQGCGVGAGSAAIRATTPERRLKLSVLFGSALDSELVRFRQAEVREMFTSCVKLRGAEPSQDIEPTLQLTTRSSRPIWCPSRISRCSIRTARGCCTSSLVLVGPSCPTAPDSGRIYLDRPCIGGPLGLYHTTLLLLDVALPKILDNDAEMVRSQSSLYHDVWFVAYNADVRMLSEQVERRAERDHAFVGSAGSTSNYNPQCSRCGQGVLE